MKFEKSFLKWPRIKKMNIWIINHYARAPWLGRPGRPWYMAEEFVKHGHSVTIITANHQWKAEETNAREFFKPIEYKKVSWVWIPVLKLKGGAINRLINMLGFRFRIPKLFKLVQSQLLKKPDLIIASSVHPFVHPPSYKLAKKFNAKYIFEVRDLWPLTLIEMGGYSRWNPLILWMSQIEKHAYRNSDKVVSPLPNAHKYMVTKGLLKENFSWISNGFSENKMIETLKYKEHALTRTISRVKLDGRKILIYAGALSLANDMQKIFENPIQDLLQNQGWSLIIVGNGDEKQKLIERKEIENQKDIYFFDFVEQGVLYPAMSQCDAGLIILKDLEIYQYGTSLNKFYDYLQCNLPILFVGSLEGNPVQFEKVGWCAKPGSKVEISNGYEFAKNISMAKGNYSWVCLGERYDQVVKGS
jgi:hypothetical protein